ncbi:MAG: DctP family TRAP transporter solute-binding subunit [Pseudomonadota bacterium]
MWAAAAIAAVGVSAPDATAQTSACQDGETKIRFSHVTSVTGHPKGEAAEKLAAAINSQMDGRLCMEIYPNSELFTDDEVLDALIRGRVEMAAPSLSKFGKYTNVFQIFDLPFLFRDIRAVEWFQRSGPGSRMRRSMEQTGLFGVAFWNNGMKQMSAIRPLLEPDDAQGLRFRIQNSELLRDQFRALGALPIPMSFKQVYNALEGAAIDGQANTWANIRSKRFYEHQDGVTETNHGLVAYMVVTSTRFWNSLERNDRRQLAGIIASVSAQQNAASQELAQKNRQELVGEGVVIRQLTAEQRARWVEVMSSVWSRYERRIGAELIRTAVLAND